MQYAYATKTEDLDLMAQTQIVMAAARDAGGAERIDAALTAIRAGDVRAAEAGTVLRVGTPDSLDVLAAPRACRIRMGDHAVETVFTPQQGRTVQAVVEESLAAVRKAGSPAAPGGPGGLYNPGK